MMHYCINPLDCLNYYPLVRDDCNLSDFTTVTAEDEPITDDGSKWATRKLHVGFKLGLKGFIKAAFEFLWEKSEFDSNINAKAETNSGDYAKLAASGDYSVVSGIGINNAAKASIGSWLVLAEWEYDIEKNLYIPVCVRAEKVDGETIKADTTYVLKNGKFVEI